MASKSLTPEQTREYLRCALDPAYFIGTYLEVRDKRLEKDVPFVLMPHQRRLIQAYEKYSRNLVQKYRQGGITSLSCAYMSYLLIFNDGFMIGVAADKLNLAENIVKTVAALVASCPEWMRTESTTDNNRIKTFVNKSEIRAFAASADGLRGFTPDFLFVDEAAYLQYGADFMASAKGTMSVSGRIVLNSTPRGEDPVYYVTYESAINKRNKYHVSEIYWYEDPRFSIDLCWTKGVERIAVTEKGQPLVVTPASQARNAALRAAGYLARNAWYYDMCAEYEGDQKRIKAEIEGEFVGSGGAMVDEVTLAAHSLRYCGDPLSTNEEEGDGHLWTFDLPAVEPDAIYHQGIDVSYGGNDFHALSIWRDFGDNLEQVLEYQCQIPPEMLAAVANELGRRYNNAYTSVDVTGGAGAVVMRELALLGYPNLHFSEVTTKLARDMLKGYEKETTEGKTMIPGFLIGANRPVMLGLVKKFIENEWLKIHSRRLMSELKSFRWNEDRNRFDHTRQGHDDLIFSLAMVLYAREYRVGIDVRLDRAQWLAMAQARAPRTAGDEPAVRLDEQGRPVTEIRKRSDMFLPGQSDGPVGGRTQLAEQPPFVLPFVMQ
jgi:hypothetical protein